MADALIGFTGFVGSNLLRQRSFDALYNSSNIDDIRGKSFDLVVCAGAPGSKWYANEHPQEDMNSVIRLFADLLLARINTLIVISTVDAIESKDFYGRHRASLEGIRERFHQNTFVVRLPAMFGPSLKKNALFDLMTETRLDEISPNATYQWYSLRRLWADLQRIQAAGIRTINLVSEPVTMEEIRRRFFPDRQIGPLRDDAPKYNILCEHPEFWLTKGEVMDEMGAFIASERGC